MWLFILIKLKVKKRKDHFLFIKNEVQQLSSEMLWVSTSTDNASDVIDSTSQLANNTETPYYIGHYGFAADQLQLYLNCFLKEIEEKARVCNDSHLNMKNTCENHLPNFMTKLIRFEYECHRYSKD